MWVLIEKLGYTVFKAGSGEDALETYRSKKEYIDLVILDMIMPGMNGEQTFSKLKEIDSDVNVLISTGFSVEGRPSLLLKKGCKGVLQKPFTYEVLSGKINEILKSNWLTKYYRIPV